MIHWAWLIIPFVLGLLLGLWIAPTAWAVYDAIEAAKKSGWRE